MAGVKADAAAIGARYALYSGDCVEIVAQLPDESVDFSLYSPPFGAQLFVFSDSERDMGNAADDEDFFARYRFLIDQKYRVTKPGCLSAVHCSDLPLTKWKDGAIGLKDFPGRIIAAHQSTGWIYHCRVTVWRDPVVEMTRTKALGLLHKQLKKDSSMSRVGMADYVLVFRKPGERAEPIVHSAEDFPVEQWQKWASPVWMDIRQTNTLNVQQARDNADEKHIAPLQLDLIERALLLWSNPGDVVLSPFAGIGSEGYMAMQHKRRFVGSELKPSYFRVAAKNLADKEREVMSPNLLDLMRAHGRAA